MQSQRKIEVLVADRDDKSRSALKLILVNAHNNVNITEAANMDNLQRLMEYRTFDIALVEWEFQPHKAYEFISQLQASQSGIIVIALSHHLEDKDPALDLGVDAFVYKGDHPELLQKTLVTYLDLASRQISQATMAAPSCSRPIFCHYLI